MSVLRISLDFLRFKLMNIDNLRSELNRLIKPKMVEELGSSQPDIEKVPMVYFTMARPYRQLASEKVIFGRTISNVGDGYNKQTGEFVCPVAGLYHLYFSFVKKYINLVYCYIEQNGRPLTLATTSSNGTMSAASTAAYVQLAVGDVVTVGQYKNWQYVIHGGDETVFTGSLIHL